MPYFDWNATAPLHPRAREVWLEASDSAWANPSTAYRTGAHARARLDEAREEVANLLGFGADQVIFTSGATEGNNGFIRELARLSSDRPVWISSIEHPSVREAALHFWGNGRVQLIPVTRGGLVDLDWMKDHLRKAPPALVSVMAANNETGVLQPWKKVRDLCVESGVPFHCDAVQWFGKMRSLVGTGCAAVTLSGHKFGAPKGVGCLILGREWSRLKILAGGAQEMDSRAGTEDIPGILAMVAALKLRMEIDPADGQLKSRDRFEAALQKEWPGEIQIHGSGTDRLWNTSSLSLPTYRSDRWISQLDRLGIQVSSGSACSTGKAGPSAILRAMGVDDETARRTIRISSGWETTAADWDELLEALKRVRQKLDSEPRSTGPGQVIQI